MFVNEATILIFHLQSHVHISDIHNCLGLWLYRKCYTIQSSNNALFGYQMRGWNEHEEYLQLAFDEAEILAITFIDTREERGNYSCKR